MVACNIVVHKMADSLASLAVEVVVLEFHNILAVADIELDTSTVVLEQVLV